MPIRRLASNVPDATRDELLRQLVHEWQHPDDKAPEPVIIEDHEVRPDEPSRFYVVWSRWDGIPQAERSEIIMDAAEEKYGKGVILIATVALGLTPREADNMGIRYRD